MTVAEILADNLRRLKASDRLTDYRDTGWLEIALEGRGGSLNVFAIEHLASMLGAEPWQLLAPLCGLGKWGGHSLYRPSANPSFPGIHVGSVRPSNVKWIADIMDRDFPELFATEEEARAAVEAALFDGGK